MISPQQQQKKVLYNAQGTSKFHIYDMLAQHLMVQEGMWSVQFLWPQSPAFSEIQYKLEM
jgi:hypothetical protein